MPPATTRRLGTRWQSRRRSAATMLVAVLGLVVAPIAVPTAAHASTPPGTPTDATAVSARFRAIRFWLGHGLGKECQPRNAGRVRIDERHRDREGVTSL